jgi:DNA-binding transcriptional LysR family regulator
VLDLRRLSVFRAVARCGSFSAAADQLGYSQPAVSHHIARLELEVGTRVLHRHPRGIELTPVGVALLRHADAILDVVQHAEGELRELVEEPDSVRLGGFQTSTEPIVSAALAAFWRSHPDSRVTLLEADPVDHIDGLRSGRLDIAVVFDSPEGPISTDDRVEVDLLHDDPMLVALPERHRLASRPAVALADLAGERWLEGAGPETTSAVVLLHACARLGFEPQIAFSCGNYYAVQQLVARGMGVALLPELALQQVRDGVALRPVADASPSRRLGTAVLRRAQDRPRGHAAMLAAIREAFAAYAGRARS